MDRVTAGIERKAGNGQWKGGPPPPGYKMDLDTHKLVVAEAEAAVIRLIFDLYTKDRLGSRAIATVLNDRGYRTRRGALWAFKRILAILEMIEAGLVDEYRLFVYPVVQGRGRRLFPDGFEPDSGSSHSREQSRPRSRSRGGRRDGGPANAVHGVDSAGGFG